MRSTKRRLATAASVLALVSSSAWVRSAAPSAAEPAAPGFINTVAGRGSGNYCGDGDLAIDACMHYPRGIAVDNLGSVFIADTSNHRVRKVSPSGVMSTFAGKGADRYCGDGGAATSACLRSPRGVAVDTDGNVFIADTDNNRVRKVAPNGTITTVAGGGVGQFCGDGGPATSACLRSPRSVAVDTGGNIFIADTLNNRVRKVAPNGTITTVAGGGVGQFCGDGGPATSACLRSPQGVAVDTDGNIFIADTANNRVRKVTFGGTMSTFAGEGTAGYCGDGTPATTACLSAPRGVATNAIGEVFVADTLNNRIRKIALDGTITTFAGRGSAGFCGDLGLAVDSCIRAPGAIAVDYSDDMFVADTNNNRARKVGKDVAPPTSLLVSATSSGGFVKSRSIPLKWSAYDPSGISEFDIAWSGYRWSGVEYPLRTWRSHVTRSSTVFQGSYGMSYCFRQRARDTVGNLSAFTHKASCAAVPLSTDQLAHGGAWERTRRSYLFAGRGLVTDKKGAQISRNGVRATKLALLVTKCPGCGRIRVYWNGNTLKTIDLYASSTKHKQLVTLTSWSAARRGNVSVKVVSSGERVLLEGLAVFSR